MNRRLSLIFTEVNRRVAGMLGADVDGELRAEFVPIIDRRERLSPNGGIEQVVVMGRLIRSQKLVQIVTPQAGWGKTLIHEIVHFYRRGATEKQVKEITDDVARYLRQTMIEWALPR